MKQHKNGKKTLASSEKWMITSQKHINLFNKLNEHGLFVYLCCIHIYMWMAFSDIKMFDLRRFKIKMLQAPLEKKNIILTEMYLFYFFVYKIHIHDVKIERKKQQQNNAKSCFFFLHFIISLKFALIYEIQLNLYKM